MKHDDYEHYKQHGICVKCRKEDAMIGATCCADCAEKRAEYDAKRHEKLLSSGLYQEHRKRQNIKSKQLRQRLREKGICYMCGKRPVEKGHTRCYECLIRERIRERKNKKGRIPRHARPDYGLCFFCGTPVMRGKRVCVKCYENRLMFLAKARNLKFMYLQKQKLNGGKNDQRKTG